IGPGEREYVAEGSCEGVIGFEPLGDGGFGYDPLFMPAGREESFAQIPSQHKHAISHRGKALSELSRKIHELFGKR
ncbi:MAG: non-canonical purine NTP pyrophosphatase, partial [Chitinivibrionales bacterium]